MTERRWEEEREVSKVLQQERWGSGNFPSSPREKDGVCYCIDPWFCRESLGWRVFKHGYTSEDLKQIQELEERLLCRQREQSKWHRLKESIRGFLGRV